MSLQTKSWYLVYTKARAEDLARENLERQGFVTYLPRIQRNKRQQGRYKPVIEALFPRYLFIQLDTETDNWMPIRSTIGVSGMIRFGGVPARVPQTLVEDLKQNESPQGIRIEPEYHYQKGEEVEVIHGAIRGYRAIFEKYVSSERIAVLLDIVGKHTRMLISKHDVQLVS